MLEELTLADPMWLVGQLRARMWPIVKGKQDTLSGPVNAWLAEMPAWCRLELRLTGHELGELGGVHDYRAAVTVVLRCEMSIQGYDREEGDEDDEEFEEHDSFTTVARISCEIRTS